MAYSNSNGKMKGNHSYGYKQGNMTAHASDYSKPEKCYSQKYTQSPLDYIERNNYLQGNEATKLRGESHMGRYDK